VLTWADPRDAQLIGTVLMQGLNVTRGGGRAVRAGGEIGLSPFESHDLADWIWITLPFYLELL